MKLESVDIFCEVIDNYGDIGVAYRLSKELKKAYPRQHIRLFVDKIEEFEAIKEEEEDLCVLPYSKISESIETADVVFECFGCKIPEIYMEKLYEGSKILFNLEYFSAETWIEDFHLQESLLGRGICRKFFYMPGISKKTGGIFTGKYFQKRDWNDFDFDASQYDWIGSIFSYEKDFTKLFKNLEKFDKKICLCILGEKSQRSIRKCLGNFHICDKIHLKFLPFYSQEKYEALLELCDFNFVRGEDSFARALLTGKPFLWHIYPQKDNIHLDKLQSFLEQYCPKDSELQKIFLGYNKGEEDYDYFFEHLPQIQEHNQTFRLYIQKYCNLTMKIKEFIENF